MRIPPLRMSKHAKVRAREFHLTDSEVIAMIHGAEVVTVSHEGFQARYGKWAIVFTADGAVGTVVTILRREGERWEHE